MVAKDITNGFSGLSANSPSQAPLQVILDKENYTSGQSARILGIPSRTMRHYLANGKIPGEQNPITGTWQVSRESLKIFLAHAGKQVATGGFASKVVIVDGDSKLEDYIRKAFAGHLAAGSIIAPESICESLIQIGRHSPSLIVIDYKLQMFSCAEIISAIRKTQKPEITKILVISGMVEGMEGMAPLGADGVLSAPFTYQELGTQLVKIVPELGIQMVG